MRTFRASWINPEAVIPDISFIEEKTVSLYPFWKKCGIDPCEIPRPARENRHFKTTFLGMESRSVQVSQGHEII